MTVAVSGRIPACPLFRGLAPETERCLQSAAHEVGVRRGETIFLQGNQAQTCFIVLEGWVKLYRVTSNGAEAIVRVQTAPETLGFCSALQSRVHIYGAEAVSGARLLAIPISTIRRLVLEDVEFGKQLLTHSKMLLEQMLDHIEALKTQSAIQRVANFLLEHCQRWGDHFVVVLPFEKALVAGILGMQPASFSRILKRLGAFGVRVTPTAIHIRQPALLKDLIETDRADAWPSARPKAAETARNSAFLPASSA